MINYGCLPTGSLRPSAIRLAVVIACAMGIFFSNSAVAQPVPIIRPGDIRSGLTPHEPENPNAPVEYPERPIEKSDDAAVLVKDLVTARFVIKKEQITTTAKPGIEIVGIPLLDNDVFRALIKPFLGKPVSMKSITEMRTITIKFFRAKDRPIVDVFIPEQEISNGVVHLQVIEATVGEVKAQGLNWFSNELILESIRLKPGDKIRGRELLDDMDYLNKNPFRFVRPILEPGKKFGTTDVIVDGKDKFPMRFYAGYDDTGSRITGLERFFAGFNIGNAFSRGHEIGYQYTTNRDFSTLGIHSAYWRIPLRNRDKIAFFGNYADYETDHSGMKQGSINWMVHARYITSLPSTPNRQQEMQLGFDFRRADNDLETGGVDVYDDYVDVAQFAFEYDGRYRDIHGNTTVIFNAYWSPFSNLLSSHQDKEHYEAVRAGADPKYAYTHLTVERLWFLPEKWSLFNRFTGQLANRRLLGSEQLGLGGYVRVRGFDDFAVVSDNGLMATIELRAPEHDLGPLNDDKDVRHYIQFLTFCDYGHARNRGNTAGMPKTADMLSIGAGLRYRINHNVKLRVDYGHQLHGTSAALMKDNGRFHISLIMSY